MFLKFELVARCGRVGLLTAGVWLAAAGLVACSTGPAVKSDQEAARKTAARPAADSPARTSASPTAPAPATSTATSSANEALVRMLAYADRARAMNAAELGQEVTRLNHAASPAEQLQLALTLSQLRQTPDLIRAQELLTRLLANFDPDAQVLHPLARLLAARYGEQRRLEDLLDKQNQQTRDLQRRLDQTNERLEALKAIERSLISRPHPPAAPAQPNRARVTAP